MTGPSNPMQEQGDTVQQLVTGASKLWTTAAQQSDSATGLGIDGRIGLVHGLVDLWVKSWVALLEGIIKSGGSLPGQPQATAPLPSEVITVEAATYPRKVECDGPFERIGLPNIKIEPPAFVFEPEILPPNLAQIRVVLKDYNYIGSNFTGKIKLTRSPAGPTLAPEDPALTEKVVTVGL